MFSNHRHSDQFIKCGWSWQLFIIFRYNFVSMVNGTMDSACVKNRTTFTQKTNLPSTNLIYCIFRDKHHFIKAIFGWQLYVKRARLSNISIQVLVKYLSSSRQTIQQGEIIKTFDIWKFKLFTSTILNIDQLCIF